MPNFKQAQRKNLKATSSKIDYIKLQLNSVIDSIEDRAGESQAKNMMTTIDNVINQLNSDIEALPIRHEFVGSFYIRKPYTQPMESIKVNGKAIMRESLVSWEVYNDEDKYIGLCREIFKDDRLRHRILREDGVAVFSNDDIRWHQVV